MTWQGGRVITMFHVKSRLALVSQASTFRPQLLCANLACPCPAALAFVSDPPLLTKAYDGRHLHWWFNLRFPRLRRTPWHHTWDCVCPVPTARYRTLDSVCFPFEEHMEHSQAVRRPTCSRELRSVCHERRDGSRTSTRDSGGERRELENPRCKNQNATFEIRRCLRTDLSKPANELETVASAPGK